MNLQEWLILLSRRIRHHRTTQHMTQGELAERSGLSLDFIRRVEVMEHSPSYWSRCKIAKALTGDEKSLEVEALCDPAKEEQPR